jgi:hypothetical protein
MPIVQNQCFLYQPEAGRYGVGSEAEEREIEEERSGLGEWRWSLGENLK